MSHQLPATRPPSRAKAAVAPPAAASAGSAPPQVAGRFGRRLLGGALLVAALGLGSCHAFWMALLA